MTDSKAAAVVPTNPLRLSVLERVLRVVAEIRPGEGVMAFVLFGGIFLLLVAYYCLKPARDGLLAVSGVGSVSKAELKAYTSFGQSLLLLALVPLYARVSSGHRRCGLFIRVSLFFLSHLLLFWLFQPGLIVGDMPFLGIAFYLWVGVFNVVMIAQFWSFAADLYSNEQGRRIFPLIALGSTSGATVGAWTANRLIGSGAFGTYTLLLVAALFLGASALLIFFADLCGVDEVGAGREAGETPSGETAASVQAFRLVFRHKYLAAIALLMLVLNWVNTNGESLLFGVLQGILRDGVTGLDGNPAAVERFIRDATTAFYANFFFWVNVCALILQALLVSRLLRYCGFALLLTLLPVTALISYSTMAFLPVLWMIKTMKIAENATNYSVNNTALQILWLPTTREMKYRGKAVTDTIFVRLGDGLAAVTMFIGINLLDLPMKQLFLLNIVLVGLWLSLAVFLVRENRRMVAC